jgi:hypothetical protein
MAFGLIILVIGYAITFWGVNHFGQKCRYSLWCLLGFTSLFKNLTVPQPTPYPFGISSGSQAQGGSSGGTYHGLPIVPAPPVREM